MSYARVTNLENSLRPVGQGVVAEELDVKAQVVAPAALDAKVSHVLVAVRGNSVKVTLDGTDPATSGAGLLLADGYVQLWSAGMVAGSRWIKGSGDAVVRLEPLSD